MCLFIQNFSSTEFNSFPSAQQCLCGLWAKMWPLPTLYKIESQLFRGRGALEAGWEVAAREERGAPVAWKPKERRLGKDKKRSRRANPRWLLSFCPEG